MKQQIFGALTAAAIALSAPLAAAAEVNVYSARKESLIKPLLDTFTEQTGIEVNLLTGDSNALIERMRTEGRNSPADLLITVDAGRVGLADSLGLFQPVDSEILTNSVPASVRSPNNHWFALSRRARIIAYHPDRVDAADLPDYETLASDDWAGRICVRSSGNIYNQSLLASLIHHNGAEAATEWASAVRKNMARSPQGNDRAQIRAVAAGECDVAIVNTYYFGIMLSDPEQRGIAEQVKVHFPNQANRGTHINVSGAGIAKHAKNVDNATALLEFLVSSESQAWYAEVNHEYPVSSNVMPSELVASFGSFKADDLNVSVLGELNADAVRVFDTVGWE